MAKLPRPVVCSAALGASMRRAVLFAVDEGTGMLGRRGTLALRPDSRTRRVLQTLIKYLVPARFYVTRVNNLMPRVSRITHARVI